MSGSILHASQQEKMTVFSFHASDLVRHFQFQAAIWIKAFVWLTFSRRRPCACVQFSQILRRPEPSRCPSGYPGKRHSWTSCELNAFSWPLCNVCNCSWWLPEERIPKDRCHSPNVTSLFTFSTVDEKIKSLPEELSAGASPREALQMSSLWAGMFWSDPQTHSRQRARSYNTWSKEKKGLSD